jgi:hypothetical protein
VEKPPTVPSRGSLATAHRCAGIRGLRSFVYGPTATQRGHD